MDGGTGRHTKATEPTALSYPDLPDAATLSTEELPADLRDTEIRERHLSAVDLSERDATGVRLIECRLDEVDLSGAILRRASIRDAVFRGGSWANVDAHQATLTRVELRGVRLTGAVLAASKIADVRFIDCRLNLSSVRFGQLERVTFENCRLEEADLYEATLTSVIFAGCDLTQANLAKATFARCEMRECELNGVGGPEQLRGVGMPWPDLVRHAAVLAQGLDVHILEDE